MGTPVHRMEKKSHNSLMLSILLTTVGNTSSSFSINRWDWIEQALLRAGCSELFENGRFLITPQKNCLKILKYWLHEKHFRKAVDLEYFNYKLRSSKQIAKPWTVEKEIIARQI